MIGQRLGKYRILEEVGQGGMSVVYRGSQAELERYVAIKVLHPHLAGRPDYRARFHREAKAVARLSHPFIPEIYDFSDDGEELAYLVTEYVPGPTLRQFAEDHPIGTPEIGAAIGVCLAQALQHAHDAKVIHRDVKPENVIIAPGGVLKLTDFGIAHVEDAQGLTATGTLLGSPAHMSPEHIEGKALDPRADIFALGTVLHWLVTGELPFLAPNPQALFRAILDGDFTPAVRERPAVGDELSAVIEKAMARSPDDRYGAARDLAAALEALLVDAGFDDVAPAELVARWFKDPEACEAAARARVTEGLVRRGRRLVSEGRTAAALRAYSRVLALAPDGEEAGIRAEIDRLLATGRRTVALRWAGVVAVGAALAAAVAVFAPSLFRGFLRDDSRGATAADHAGTADRSQGEGETDPPGSADASVGSGARTITKAAPASSRVGGAARSRSDGPAPAPSDPRRRVPPPSGLVPTAPPPGEEVRVASATTLGTPPAPAPGPIWLPIKAHPYADVYLDDVRVASLPQDKRIQVAPGPHEVVFRKTGNRDRKFHIDVPSDGVGLRQLAFWWPATIEVRGAPRHIVQVEGKDLGTTDAPREFPMSAVAVEGARVVVLDPASGHIHEERVTLQAGGRVVLDVPARAAPP